MKLFKKGQGATEYLLMLAAVLVIVAIAVYYVTSAAPSAVITGQASLATGDNTTVVFKPTSLTPSTISAGDWEWAIYRDGTAVKSWTTSTDNLVVNIEVALSGITGGAASGDKVKIRYKDTVYDAATVG